MYQDNLIITLNSKNATLMNSTLKSSVNFNFVSVLKEEDDIVRSYISVINAQIPMSYYLITSANNKRAGPEHLGKGGPAGHLVKS